MDQAIQKRIEEWSRPPFDAETIAEIKALAERKDEKELADRFYTTLEFGTGGLRGIIGAGTNRMNIHTVGMATQGLANYLIKKGKQREGVVIARDSRRMSADFAREAASILSGNGIRVYFFDEITPTPLCSFAIRHLGAGSGIVITASHNPPEYNGYKVYWDDGGQIVPPFDREIIGEVKRIASIGEIKKADFERARSSGMLRVIGDEILGAYLSRLEKAALRPRAKSDIRIVYTPLHGTGHKIVPRVLRHFGFENLLTVEAQSVPDGGFPTVDSPNPEERDALAMAIELSIKEKADIFMATDPDADRMGVGFRRPDGGYEIINGNQIGTMLEHYLLQRLSREGRLPANAALVKTIVTTDLQERIAERFNCATDNVLTGFKYIAMKMKEYEESGERRFIFGGEESYGYLPVDFVRDKDAVSSCYFFAEMADYLRGSGSSLHEFLREIYLEYGLYLEDLQSLTMKGMDGMERISRIMSSFRKNPPEELAGIRCVRMDDVLNLVSTDRPGGKSTAIQGLPKSDVLQFFLEDGSKVTMRPSGTEPKIKFYFSVNDHVSADDLDSKRDILRGKIERLKSDLGAKIGAI